MLEKMIAIAVAGVITAGACRTGVALLNRVEEMGKTLYNVETIEAIVTGERDLPQWLV